MSDSAIAEADPQQHRRPRGLADHVADGVADDGAIRLADLLGALSAALDLTEGQPVGHAVRCCWIGVQIGRQLGMDEAALSDLYYALLLKDLGCSSNAARICQLYLTDDRSFKQGFKLVGDSLPQALRFVLAHTGLKANLSERFGAVLNIVRNGGEVARELIETRCQRGAEIARTMRFSEAVATGILDLDEHWNGGGKPVGLAGEQISLFARIALLAQVVDVFHHSGGPEQTRAEVASRSGNWFDPRVVQAFEQVSASPGFWATLRREDIGPALFALAPGRSVIVVDDDYLDDIAAGFAKVIDAKSPFTSNHSERVTLYTDVIARELGMSPEARRWLKRAALLHDIGKLGVSNQVLDKPGKLDAEEWVVMRSHSALGDKILSRIGAFRSLAIVARGHHERLDGKGYPDGLHAAQIPLETRIVSTADVFDALTADRPYRGAMPLAKAIGIIQADLGTALDADCFAALRAGLASIGFVE